MWFLSAPKEFKLLKELDNKNLTLGFYTQTTNQNVNKKATQSSSKTLNTNYKSGKLVVIDAGHGGKDSGALSDKKGSLKEKDIALSMTLKLGNELKKRGYKVLYTRSSDKLSIFVIELNMLMIKERIYLFLYMLTQHQMPQKLKVAKAWKLSF